MAMAPVHFAVGMGVAVAVGVAVVAVRRRRLLYMPLVASVCGVVALLPALVAREGAGPAGRNLFFFYHWIDNAPWLATPRAGDIAFQVVALVYLLVTCGYAVFIRWGVPRMEESAQALGRMETAALAYRPLTALLGIVPLLLVGGAAAWLTRTASPPQLPAEELRQRDDARWQRLVSGRLGFDPGPYIGLVRGQAEADGQWLVGDLGVHTKFSGGAATLDEVVERAQASRCNFVVAADGAGLGSPEKVKAYMAALKAVRSKFRDIAVLSGLTWRVPSAGAGASADSGVAATVVVPQVDEGEVLAGLHRRLGAPGSSPAAALRWLQARSGSSSIMPLMLAGTAGGRAASRETLFSWLRSGDVFLGIMGLTGGERPAAMGRWDPRVSRVGGVWDELLDRGFQVWGAVAASGFGHPKRHYWPGEQVRTHVWCRGRRPAHVLEGLRNGRVWAEEGGVVRGVDFALMVPMVEHPARMGDVLRVAPGVELVAELTLEIPERDLAGRAGRIDEVELISNFAGEPQVMHRFRSVRNKQVLRHVFPPAADHNGGVGFTVRARGRRRLDASAEGGAGGRLFFYTNPIRVLVRPGDESPEMVARRAAEKQAAAKTASRPRPKPPAPEPSRPVPPKPSTATPTTLPPTRQLSAIEAMGLPPDLRVVHFEAFAKPPGRQWRGLWTKNVGDTGPAIRDESLQISTFRGIPIGKATRLTFRCQPTACGRLTMLLRTSRSRKPYQRVFELPDGKWTRLDLSLRDAFHPPLGAPGRLGPGDEVDAIEWRAEGLSPKALFYVADYVVYERTRQARVAFARQRAGEQAGEGRVRREGTLERALLEALALGKPSRAWQARAEKVANRLAACQRRLAESPQAMLRAVIGAIEHELDALAEEIQRLRLQATTARAFALSDPPYAVGVESATARLSARNPACAFEGQAAKTHELWAAAGEAESFQVAVQALWQPLHAVDVTWTEFRPERGNGSRLPRSAVSAALASELWVTPRADLPRGRSGWTPDPLTPFVPFDLAPGELRSVVLTVRVAADLPPGDYVGSVRVQPVGQPPVEVAVRLHRWDFALVANHFPVVGSIDARALREQYHDDKQVPEARRRELYSLLLRHRIHPVPLLSGSDEANLADITFCLEHGLALAVVHRTASAVTAAGPGLERAARYAAKIREAGWGTPCGVMVPAARGDTTPVQLTRALRTVRKQHPRLAVIAGGEGQPPAGLAASYWRRPLGIEELRRPGSDAVGVRRTRSTRVEAWELGPVAPDYPAANATLTNLLVETRVLPWLAWSHGVRALFLASVNRWQDNNRAGGLLVYPSAAGTLCGSLRLVALRDGIEDYECLWLLWDRMRRLQERAPQRHLGILSSAARVAAEVERRVGTMARPVRDLHRLAALRVRVGRVVERLEAAWWEEVDGADDLPAPPPSLVAKPGDGQVTLAWGKSPDDKITAYHVYRSCDPKIGFVRVSATPIAALTYADTSANNDVRYHYFVRSCREADIEGPRSAIANTVPRPAPKVVWLPMADLTQATTGPYHVALRLTGPGTGGMLPLVRPQIDYCLSDGFYDGFEEMSRLADGTWTFAIPALDWRRNADKTLRVKVQILDRRNRIVTPAAEREDRIDAVSAPRK